MIELDKDCKIYNDNVEDEALQTIYTVINSGAFNKSPIRIMPDVHNGKGIVIGFTAPLSDCVNPEHVGVDIGCCIDTWITNIGSSKVIQERLIELEKTVRNLIPFGFNININCQTDKDDFIKQLNNYVDSCANSWSRIYKKTYTLKDIEAFCNRIALEKSIFWNSLGTIGGGNHFIEFGLCNDKLCYTIHCGSRNLGVKVAKYHYNVANNISKGKSSEQKAKLASLIANLKAEGRQNEIQEKIIQYKKEFNNSHSEGYLYGREMDDYLNDMVLATFYSLYNHSVISAQINKCICNVFKEPVAVIKRIRSIHNYIDMQDHIIRKGAIRSYKGELMVVPFNMKDGIAICEGKSNSEWNYSCSHGTGRKMSRSKAKEILSLETFTQQMQGIVSTSVCPETLDEAPDAYKDTQEIINLIQDTCEIKTIVKPLINLKAKQIT